MSTYVFRGARFSRRRREIVSEENNTPVNVPPGEFLYDEENNKLYVGVGDGPATVVAGGDFDGIPPDAVINGGNY